MPGLVFDDGIIHVTVRYVVQRPNGSLMYQRRIPKDLLGLMDGKVFVRRYLGRCSMAEAAKRVSEWTRQDEAQWASLRAFPSTPEHVEAQVDARLDGWRKVPRVPGGEDEETPSEAEHLGDLLDDYLLDEYGGSYYDLKMGHGGYTGTRGATALKSRLSAVDFETYRRVMAMQSGTNERPTLSRVLEHYLASKGDAFRKSAGGVRRHIGIVTATVGDRPLESYRRAEARKVLDAMLSEQRSGGPLKTTSVRRAVNDIRSVFNHGRIEFDLTSLGNPFEALKIPEENADAAKRLPFTEAELRAIASSCRERDDDGAHILGIMLETGARLSEVVGLRCEDVFLGEDVPFVWVRPHKAHGRTVKTAASIRKVPLVGLALWAAERAHKDDSGWLFPRYASERGVKASSASAALNPWLRKVSGVAKTTHCFRHAMKDRLRSGGVPEDIQQALIGHGTKGVSRAYGEGYPMTILRSALERVCLS